jgi:hypothetical protein
MTDVSNQRVGFVGLGDQGGGWRILTGFACVTRVDERTIHTGIH